MRLPSISFEAVRCKPWPWSLVAVGVLAGSLQAQPTHPATGRAIAPVMSHLGADWLERPEREQEERPEMAVEALGLEPGMAVADIGAGTGYFSRRMARRVAPGGKVYAVDIQPEMLALLEQYARRDRIANIVPVPGTAADPKLPPEAIDLAIMVDVYHELAQPAEFLRRLRKALKPDGRLVLLEYRKEDPTVPIRLEHKMTIEEVRRELEPEGFHLERVFDRLPRQHLLVFRLSPL